MYEMFIVYLYYCGAKNYMNDQFETKLHDCRPVKKPLLYFSIPEETFHLIKFNDWFKFDPL